MPIYSYRCQKCNEVEEVTLPIEQRDLVGLHSCGGQLLRMLSLPLPAIIAKTGKGMALDTLNSGKALPNRGYKSKYERLAAKGLESHQRRVW